ncbi:hypothetical protein [Thermicanus aegyptius]|uniref:hypothetical protein n=1 Tax=Thermicanus aegyptius TaxID=94009 RepID=UPI0004164729|nr:hypothetical protein [Thermicanus aegyptius]
MLEKLHEERLIRWDPEKRSIEWDPHTKAWSIDQAFFVGDGLGTKAACRPRGW